MDTVMDHGLMSHQVERYFWGEGKVREQGKDQKRLLRSKDNGRGEKVNESTPSDGDFKESKLMKKEKVETPLRVLDVGSCYNPFGECERWQVGIILQLQISYSTACLRTEFNFKPNLCEKSTISISDHRFYQLTLPLPHLGESPIITAVVWCPAHFSQT